MGFLAKSAADVKPAGSTRASRWHVPSRSKCQHSLSFTGLSAGDLTGKRRRGVAMRFIPTRMHAGMDYLVGVLLVAAPWIFQFADESSAATWISVIAGVALIGLSAMTDYEGGIIARAIPMRAHLATDALLGLFLVVSPWLFGFADEGAN